MSKEFVLVHGMSHGAWCWERVAPRLERGGHRVLAVDLPGHVPPARAAEYAARLGVTPLDLDTAHGPMLSDPKELVSILERL